MVGRSTIQSEVSETNDLLMANVEALTLDENNGTLVRNFKSGSLWYTSGGSVSFVEPFLSFYYTRITCCLPGTDMDGCDFTKEDADCSKYAIRPAH